MKIHKEEVQQLVDDLWQQPTKVGQACALRDLINQSKVPPELETLSNKATPGEWSWKHDVMQTDYNPTSRGFSKYGSGFIYQAVLWPDNSLGTDDRSVSELMGACGTDTEDQAEANQKLLVACVNYVRQLIDSQKEQK